MEKGNGNDQNGDGKEQSIGMYRTYYRFKNDEVFRQQMIHTLILGWSFIGSGWHAGMSGPVFPDLRQIIQEGLAKSSWIFTIEQCGYLCGSLIGGILYDKLNKVLLLAVSSFGFGVFILLTPYCSSLSAMLFIKCAGGFFFGSLDTGCYADIISVWGEHVGTYMQALNFAFSIGTLLSPLATEPFLAVTFTTCESSNKTSDNVTDKSIQETTNAAISNVSTTATLVTKIATLDNSTIVSTCNCETLEETNVRYAFLMSSFFMFSGTICYIYIYIKIRRNKRKITIAATKANSKDDMCHKRNEMSINLKIIVLSILSLLVSLSCAAEDSFSGFLATFSLDYLEWDTSTGSYATAVFRSTYCAGNFCGIFILSCCEKSTLLTIYLCLLLLSNIAFTLTSFFQLYPLIWVSIAAIGFSVSMITPTIFSWTSEYIIHVSGKMSGLFLSSSSISGMLFSLLIGHLMENFYSLWYSYVLLITALTCNICFVSLRAIKRFYLK